MDTVPLRVAVVGSGPAGFYAVAHLLSAPEPIEVDLIERLPTPWGLVRLGVAPDHPNIKAVSRAFEKIARQDGFRFLGNVEIGRDLSHDELTSLYDGIVYAVGAQSDRRLGVPGEDLPGSWPATAFVGWYNGHPDFQDLHFDLDCERAVVIGNGNVAVDVARMLALTAEELGTTDTTDEAIAAINGAGLREIVIVGRRGPVQGAFTPPELKELGELAGADVLVDAADLELDPASAAALESADAIVQRNVEVLRGYTGNERSAKPRAVRLRFCLSPVAILGGDRVEAIELERNRLVAGSDGQVRAEATGERETLPCGIVFRSVGYRGTAIAGVPFDDVRAIVPNERGRVLGAAGTPVPGLYCTGWIKRGPSGVIGTNKKDATETAERLLEDVRAGVIAAGGAAAAAVDALLAGRGVQVVDYTGWEAIDSVERGRGEPQGRPRVKLTRWHDLLAAARG